VGTGGETLDPIYNATLASSSDAETGFPLLVGPTNMEDPTGNPGFNAANLEAYSGDYWGVMALTLDPNGYHWDFESAPGIPGPSPTLALNGPTLPAPNASGVYSDKGSGSCHNSPF
jgi:hypothetical protein